MKLKWPSLKSDILCLKKKNPNEITHCRKHICLFNYFVTDNHVHEKTIVFSSSQWQFILEILVKNLCIFDSI